MTVQSAKTKTRPQNANLIDVDPDDGVRDLPPRGTTADALPQVPRRQVAGP